MKTININQYTRRALLCRFVMLLSGGVFLGSTLPISAEENTPPVDKTQIVGVWYAKPFADAVIVPRIGLFSAVRIEFKEGGKFRALMKDDTEAEGTWEWKSEPETEGLWAKMSPIELTYTKLGVKLLFRFTQLSKESMSMMSSQGQYTHYFRFKYWDGKSPSSPME